MGYVSFSRAGFPAFCAAAVLSVGMVLGAGAEPAFASETAGIAFFAQSTSKSPTELWGAKADGSEPFAIRSVKVTGLGEMREPALSPDGKSVAVAYSNDIGVIDVKTGELTTVYDGSSVPNNPNAAHPRWSPDGKRLIFVADVSTASKEAIRGHVYTVKSNGTDLQKLSISLPFGQTRVRDPSYSPSGQRIVFVGFTDNAQEGHIYTAKANGSGVQTIYSDPGVFPTTQLRSVSFSPDSSSVLFVRSGDEFQLEVHLIPAGGGGDLQLTTESKDPGANEDPTWLPSGATIAYANNGHIKVMDPAGEGSERLFSAFAADWAPSYRQPEHDEALENEELLAEYRPELIYDTQESYRTDSPAEITDNWGSDEGFWVEGENGYTNALWSGGVEEEAQEIARSSPELEPGQFRLTLESLGSTYPSELEARENDWIDERNDHYAEDAQELEGHPGYVNHDYARAVADSEGNLWLEYWFFYYYDESSFLIFSTGSHEGDWEMMMVKLNEARTPVQVVYAQHEDGSRCAWGETESNFEGRPVAYVATGTHATYPYSGSWALPSGVPEDDHADGEGGAASPLVEPVGEANPSWVSWPGRWGGTTPEVSEEIGEASSPVGPAQHSQWSDPAGFAAEVAECAERYDGEEPRARVAPLSAGAAPAPAGAPAPEILSAVHRGNHVVVTYRLPAGIDRRQASLIVSVNPSGGRAAPLSEAVPHPPSKGKIHLSFKVGPDHDGVVLASLVEGRGRSPVVTAPIE